MLWNVHGLESALHLLEIESTQQDILMLTETWTSPDIQAPDIPGYTCFSSSRNFKHALAWRASGGVACYVKDAIASRFELWRVSSPGSILWLRSKEKLHGFLVTPTCTLALCTSPLVAHLQKSKLPCHSRKCFSKTLQMPLQTMVWLLWLAISMPEQDLHLAPAWKISAIFWTPPYSQMDSSVNI